MNVCTTSETLSVDSSYVTRYLKEFKMAGFAV